MEIGIFLYCVLYINEEMLDTNSNSVLCLHKMLDASLNRSIAVLCTSKQYLTPHISNSHISLLHQLTNENCFHKINVSFYILYIKISKILRISVNYTLYLNALPSIKCCLHIWYPGAQQFLHFFWLILRFFCVK